MIKCVVWDLDNTLLDGTFLESPDGPPPADPAMTAVLAELAGRGILQALATRNPPDAAAYAEQLTGHAFAAAECGWDDKSLAIGRIVAALGLAADAVAFVDDDPIERAEVSFALPDVLVLAPEDMPDAAGWPQFTPAVLTDEGRRRGELYRQRQVRQDRQRRFAGSRDEFLRYCQTQVRIGAATAADLPRLHELSVRTRQFNSAGQPVSMRVLADQLGAAGREVIAVRLADRFGDDGLVGGCLIETGHRGRWDVPLLMMSCRAMGRGVIDAVLAWLCQAAKHAGAGQVGLSCGPAARNLPLRIALTQAGFRAGPAARPGGVVRYTRLLDGAVPALPDWASWQQQP